MCSAIYGQKVLGIDYKLSKIFKEALMDGNELLRMGFTRLSFNYTLEDKEVDYVLNAIEFICNYGWMFLPHYKFDQDLGIWVNRDESEIE